MESLEKQKKVAIYARVSAPKQAEHEISIDDQIKQLKDYAEEQGWKVVKV